MTQANYDIICKVIQNGAPALANELIGAISNLITDANALLKERDELKAKLEEIENGKCDECRCADTEKAAE